LHATQVRKQTDIPYISHLIGVAGIVLEYGGGRDEAIAALLHDSIEDQAREYGGAQKLRADIRATFGERVLDIVEGCTDADVEPKPPWQARKEAYLKHLEEVDDATRLVSCADKLHNARAIVADLRVMGNALFERFNAPKPKADTLWYYRALANIFIKQGPARLAAELGRTVDEMERLGNGTA
jgi:(p)ppGpp synthase/HD superfamily hydrolase